MRSLPEREANPDWLEFEPSGDKTLAKNRPDYKPVFSNLEVENLDVENLDVENFINSLTECTDPDPVNDSLIIYDASTASHKRISPENAFSPPIGFTYTQYPGKDDPATLGLPGTWSNVSSSFAGDFFRAEGGAALAFNGGRQSHGIESHIHGQRQAGTGAGGYMTGKLDCGLGSATGYIAPGIYAYTNYIISTVSNSGYANETRPVNQTIRIWERIS